MKTAEFDLVVVGGGVVGCTIAALAAAKGRRVAIIEKGPEKIEDQQAASPEIVFSRRAHVGVTKARNHVLCGNGAYWGGGLIRPPRTTLEGVLDLDRATLDGTQDIERYFDKAERSLGLDRLAPRQSLERFNVLSAKGECAEILVLPGRSRNVARFQLDRVFTSGGGTVLPNTRVEGFRTSELSDGTCHVDAVLVSGPDGIREVTGRSIVIAAGVVDTIHTLLASQGDLGIGQHGARLGTAMHDHLSVPIARVTMSKLALGQELISPRFRDGLVVGRHFEIAASEGWGAQGFLHFACMFDEASPYKEIKQLMLLRQQRGSVAEMARAGSVLLRPDLFSTLIRIGADRFFRQRLHLAASVEICATLDFEMYPHPSNSLSLQGDKMDLSWDVSTEDENSFWNLLQQARTVLGDMSRAYSLKVEPLFDWGDAQQALAHLHAQVVDAFHLGGGTACGSAEDSIADHDLRIRGTDNLFAVSTSVLGRPTVVNPTHMLLALAERLADQQL